MPVRKIPKSAVSIRGWFSSRINRRSINYESTLERDFYLSLEFDPDVFAYEEQPVRISYHDEAGKLHTYTLDALVHYRPECDKPSLLAEIKPRAVLDRRASEFESAFTAARDYASKHGMRFDVLTEKEIRPNQVRVDNLKLLYHFSSPPTRLNLYQGVIDEILWRRTPIAMKDLLSEMTDSLNQKALIKPVLWHMIFRRSVIANLDLPLGNQTILYAPENNR